MEKMPKILVYSDFNSGGDIVRDRAQKFEGLHMPVPRLLGDLAAKLLAVPEPDFFPVDGVTSLKNGHRGFKVPESRKLLNVVRENMPVAFPIGLEDLGNMKVTLTREVSYHHDEVYTEKHLFFSWVLGLDGPLAFLTEQGSVPVSPGSFLVFDAQTPHALLREGRTKFRQYTARSKSPRMVFVFGTVALTPANQARYGIRFWQTDQPWLGMNDAMYSRNTGRIISGI